MSRFLNDVIQKLSPQSIHLDIQGEQAQCCFDDNSEKNVITWKLDTGFDDYSQYFEQLLINGYKPGAYLHVTMPDRFSRLFLLNISQGRLNKSKKMDFVKWVLINDFHLDVEQFDIKIQECESDKGTIIVSLINKDVLNSILRSANNLCVPISFIDSFTIQSLSGIQNDVVLLCVDVDCVTVLLVRERCPIIVRRLPEDAAQIENELHRIEHLYGDKLPIVIRTHGEVDKYPYITELMGGDSCVLTGRMVINEY